MRGSGRTAKLGFHALAHEAVFYFVQRPEDIRGHDGLFALEGRDLIGAVVTASALPRGTLQTYKRKKMEVPQYTYAFAR